MTLIVATMATFPGRAGVVEQAVASMADQVDRLNLVLNEYRDIPEWTRNYPSLHPIIPEVDTKDTGKYLVPVAAEDLLFTLDDDILYPPDYVRTSMDSLQSRGHPGLIGGYHGSVYKRPRFLPSKRWARKLIGVDPNYIVSSRTTFPFHDSLDRDVVVDQLGTGTTFSRGADVPPFSAVQSAQRFIDVRLAHWAHRTGRKMVCMARPAQWMQSVELLEAPSIFRSFTVSRPEHVALEIEDFAFRNREAGHPL
jgi:hypothetical protein